MAGLGKYIYLENSFDRNIVAITGTNGKSTTTKLIGNLFKKNNFPKGNYQILCKNCNMSKSDKFDCCHKRK